MRIRARVRIVDSKQQRGFSLPETLIAAVIAAGVVAAAATSIGASAR
ncbi:MAG: prepilin-type N-terminal cleavage/methylation domain-containing protein, partial [Pseudomonadota bacterium]